MSFSHLSQVSRLTALPLTLCAALAAQAQTTPAEPRPAAHDHASEPHVLDQLVVSASPLARSQAELVGSTSVLAGDALLDARQPSLGETLAGLPGVSSTYFGPGASRPVLRGLGANRVRVLANSTDTLDVSNASPDHAVSVEPFLVKRIEVVRGPASLLYGSSAIGGVVNVIDRRAEPELPARPVSGLLEGSLTDNGAGYAAGGALDIALGAPRADGSGFVLHLDGFRREADDLDVPGDSGQTGAPRGTLLNSDVSTRGASIGLGYVSETFDATLGFSGLDSFYGVPPEDVAEIVDIDLRQRRVDASAVYKREFGVFDEARVKFGQADYEHVEFENGARESVFENRGFDGRVELINGDIAGWTGAVGTQLTTAKLTATDAFLPTHRTTQGALFFFQERTVADTTWQLGGRVERQRIRADEFVTTDPLAGTFPARGDDRTTFGGSFGAIHRLGDDYRLFGTYSYTERAPTGQELYAHGKHHGTHAYEIGDPTLEKERGHGFELGVRRVKGAVTGSVSGFAHVFDGYIYERETGLDVNENNEAPAPGDETFHQVVFSQTDALFYGAEAEAIWHLHAEKRHTLDLTTGLDYVRATDSSGDSLPRIPPLKARLALDWRRDAWRAGADATLVARQWDSTPDEGDTDGYALIGATLGYCLETRHATYDFFVRGSNLSDEEARLHTSFLKDIAPLPGRAFTAGVRASF